MGYADTVVRKSDLFQFGWTSSSPVERHSYKVRVEGSIPSASIGSSTIYPKTRLSASTVVWNRPDQPATPYGASWCCHCIRNDVCQQRPSRIDVRKVKAGIFILPEEDGLTTSMSG